MEMPMQQNEMDKKRMQDEEEALNHPVTIDGHKLKLRDVFPDAYAAKEFRTKLKLLNSRASGEPDAEGLDMLQKSKKDQEDISNDLFGPRRKQEKNPVGMDGE